MSSEKPVSMDELDEGEPASSCAIRGRAHKDGHHGSGQTERYGYDVPALLVPG